MLEVRKQQTCMNIPFVFYNLACGYLSTYNKITYMQIEHLVFSTQV